MHFPVIRFRQYFQPLLIAILLMVCAFRPVAKAGVPDTTFMVPTIQFNVDTISGLVADEDEVRAGLLYDVQRNTIVWEKDMDYAYPIASLTKMMVGLLAIEDIEAGKVHLTDTITVTRTFKKRISRRRYSCVAFEQHYTLEDLLKMAMVASHNESTVWIARHCDSTLEAFVERMNRKALDLGMTKTLYSNPSGLPAIMDELDNSASARDMLILALEVLKHPKLREITSIDYMTVSNGRGHESYHNHNGLAINYHNEVDGIKTGYTKAAKFCLVATSMRGNYRMISVVLGVRSPWVRNGIVASMLNTYYDALNLGRLGDNQPDLAIAQPYIDSVLAGTVRVRPLVEPRHQDSSDEAYAFTYKTVTQKVKKTYKVRSGDNLGRIADKFNVTVSDIRKWNRLKSSHLQKGKTLAIWTTTRKKIPVKLVVDPDEPYADNQPSYTPNECNPGEVGDYSVQESDSANLNQDMKEKDTEPDQPVLAEQKKSTHTAKTKLKPGYIYHTVQTGDTLWNIAQRYQANIEQIKRVNRISNSRFLKKGTRIKIPIQKG